MGISALNINIIITLAIYGIVDTNRESRSQVQCCYDVSPENQTASFDISPYSNLSTLRVPMGFHVLLRQHVCWGDGHVESSKVREWPEYKAVQTCPAPRAPPGPERCGSMWTGTESSSRRGSAMLPASSHSASLQSVATYRQVTDEC